MIEARQPDSDMIVSSKLHLVDLAGSERVYKREGTQRMRSEGKHINLSLHHLEQVDICTDWRLLGHTIDMKACV